MGHIRHLAAGLLLIFLITGVFLRWNDHQLFLFFGVLYFFICGYALARSFLSLSKMSAALFAPLCTAIPLFIGGAGIYFFYKIDALAALILLCIPFICMLGADLFSPQCEKELGEEKTGIQCTHVILFAALMLFLAFFWYVLFHSQTTDALLGPWAALRRPVFIPYFLATIALLGMILSRAPNILSLLSLCAFFVSIFSVLLVVFPLGFGFDPHLHQATERAIARDGLMLPKQLYYLGQYALIAFLSKLFAISANTLDRIFLPLLSGVSIPIAALLCSRAYSFSKKSSLLFALFGLFIPFGYAVFTVPWNIASLLTIIFSYVSIAYIRSKYKGILIFLFLLAIAALSIHPLAGLPLLGVFICLIAMHIFRGHKKRTTIITGITLLFGASVPLAFWLNSLRSTQLDIIFKLPSWGSIQTFLNLFSLHADTRFSAALDFIHIIYQNSSAILLLLTATGLILSVWKSHFFWKQSLFPLIGAGICVMNYLLIEGFFSFPSLISYEQHDYANRMLSLAVFFLIPPTTYALVVLFEKLLAHPSRIFRVAWLIFFAGILTGSFYLSYPSNDVYRSFHGYTISQADINAARTIQKHAGGEPYIVLANQVVSAAAIREFGFQKYFDITQNGATRQYFYYPIPTSSPLYGFFIDMQAYPQKETIQRAMELFNVKKAYVVVTRYEDRYAQIIERARVFADFSKSINNGADVVFGYTK